MGIGQKKEQMVVLCFGDSLTEGYHNFGRQFSPYTLVLEELGYAVENHGVSGERCRSIRSRLSSRLARDPAETFDHSVLLAGTNDVEGAPHGFIPDQIDSMVDMLLPRTTGKLIVMTVPDLMDEDWSRALAEELDAANAEIRQRCAGKAVVLDLAVLTRVTTDEKRDLWEPDGVHFSPKGYETIGNWIAEILREGEAREGKKY